MKKPSTVFPLPFDGLLRIWRYCYKHNEEAREKLNKFDSIVSTRKVIIREGREFVQLTQNELTWIKNLYEEVF